MNIVVVESPAKAKPINQFLGKNFLVLASYGHIRNLPPKNGSVRPEDNFAMTYELEKNGIKRLKAISDALNEDSTLFLATDPDREGEAIAWHILSALKDKKGYQDLKVKRVIFHEITKKAVIEAFSSPRDIDMNLVDAQQARRALDYLVGFHLSPVLWRKLPGTKSAGRVQSVALRLIVSKEEEIDKFIKREYWSINTNIKTFDGKSFLAKLSHWNTNKLKKFDISDKNEAVKITEKIEKSKFTVSNIEYKTTKRNPSPPFITSTLQQEANRKLGFSANHTMQIAQNLYEGVNIEKNETVGLISYMRTDSVTLSKDALQSIREEIEKIFGSKYLPTEPRYYKNRSKNVQEAHEAIRPTYPNKNPKTLSKYLNSDQLKLYELIWNRTLACQMTSAEIDKVIVDLESKDKSIILRANGSKISFQGFIKVYSEDSDDNNTDELEEAANLIPKLTINEEIDKVNANPLQHFTEPSPRFTEASLVKKLEELGIGRPSTYASIISVLQKRNYVTLESKRFIPNDLGRLVTAFLRNFFAKYVEYDFTEELENQLDRVARGEIILNEVLGIFWKDFKQSVDDTSQLRIREVLDNLNIALSDHIFPKTEDNPNPRICNICKNGELSLKPGKNGFFIGCSNYPECKFTRQLKVENDENKNLIGEDGKIILGNNNNGIVVSLRKGPYGIYIQLGEKDTTSEKPKRVSIPEKYNVENIDLKFALALLDLPKEIGLHPETGNKILAGIGRFGPYVKHDNEFRSIPKDDDIFSIGINRAVDLLAQPKRGSTRKGQNPIKTLGKHSLDGNDILIFDGRYGPYLKHNNVNATIPKGVNIDNITITKAVEILNNKKKK